MYYTCYIIVVVPSPLTGMHVGNGRPCLNIIIQISVVLLKNVPYMLVLEKVVEIEGALLDLPLYYNKIFPIYTGTFLPIV